MTVKVIKEEAGRFMALDGGNITLYMINDGVVPYHNNCFAPDISRDELNNARRMNDEEFQLANNILLMVSGDKVVLIDSGNGAGAEPGAGNLIKNLAAAGFTPDKVTDVVLSHAHPDHINGLINVDGAMAFPEATIHLCRNEYAFWWGEQPDFSNSKNDPQTLTTLQQHIKSILGIVSPRLKLFEATAPLFDFLQPLPAYGHTPGHCMFAVETDHICFIHMADICHDSIVLFRKPEWGTVFDIDFMLAGEVRRSCLEKFADTGALVLGYHMPWPGLGGVSELENGFHWHPEKIFFTRPKEDNLQ